MLLPFGGGTVVESAIERIRASHLIDAFVLATSVAPADDVFEDIAGRCELSLVRGSEEDVVARMVQAVDSLASPPDVVVRVCSDNPLLMPDIVDQGVAELIETRADVITPFEDNTYPFGYSLVAMSAHCLKRIDGEAKEATHREHVEKFCFDNSGRFHIIHQMASAELAYPELGLTLDYEVDYRRLAYYGNEMRSISIHRQSRRLVDRARRCRVGIICAAAGNAGWFRDDLPWGDGVELGFTPEGRDLLISALPFDEESGCEARPRGSVALSPPAGPGEGWRLNTRKGETVAEDRESNRDANPDAVL